MKFKITQSAVNNYVIKQVYKTKASGHGFTEGYYKSKNEEK